MVRRRVGTHIQKTKRYFKIEPVPQTKKRKLIKRFDNYEEALKWMDTRSSDYPLQIRRQSKFFGVYERKPI